MSNLKETIREGDRGAAVRELQTKLNAVGAHINVDGVFGEVTDETVRDFQAYAGITEDGVCGPETWQRLEMALARRQHMDSLATSDRLVQAGEDAVARALALWHVDVEDRPQSDDSHSGQLNKAIIDKLIRGGDALNWTWENAYAGDGDFEWCGAFAAYCWPEVKQPLRQLYFASTPRLDRYASYRSFNGEENKGTGRLYVKLDENSKDKDVAEIWRPGDILIIGPAKPTTAKPGNWRDCGQHICIVESYADGVFHTIEGNGNGEGPHGEKQQGVVKGKRCLGGPGWHARRLIRPSEEDLV